MELRDGDRRLEPKSPKVTRVWNVQYYSMELQILTEDVLNEVEACLNKQPLISIISLHHIFRNLFPYDPHITNNNELELEERINKALLESRAFLELGKGMGFYERLEFEDHQRTTEVKKLTGTVYGELWEDYSKISKDIVIEAKELLEERFNLNGFSLKDFAKGSGLDAGCGSGRYTLALAEYSERVIGFDFSVEGLKVAENLARSSVRKNRTSFIKGNLLDLPFPKNSFDFVFSNGTAHHTEIPEVAIKELFRVCKPGGKLYLYVYGFGGVYGLARKRMNQMMKKIPREFTRSALDLLGMPPNRFIFQDNWYVPIEHHLKNNDLQLLFEEMGAKEVKLFARGRRTDLCTEGNDVLKKLYGDGDLRYIISV